jgi:hypothetical protein
MLWIKGSKTQEADACRKIVHFRHTLVKFLKPFFSRSFGAVNLKKHVCVGVAFVPAQSSRSHAAGVYVMGEGGNRRGSAKWATLWGGGRSVRHRREGKARSGGVLIIGARL